MHISGADAVDPDAVRGHFACKGLREPNKGGLRRGVGDLTGIGYHVARDRAGDDAGPGVVAHHGGQGHAADVPDTLDVDVDMCIAPHVVAGKEVAERADAGVAVENVDCPVRLEGEVDKVLAGLGIAHVAAKADRFPPAACSSSANCKTSLPRAASTTHAPSSVNTRAIPAPMPLEAPVIMAIFPSSLPMLTSSL